MAGTADGARKAIETKREIYGDLFFAKNGRKGGLARNMSPKKYNPFSDVVFAKKMAKKANRARWEGHVKAVPPTKAVKAEPATDPGLTEAQNQ
jgi:hypothetical protein